MSKETAANNNAVNLLCEGTVIVGDIKTKNDIRIDGMIKGKIVTSGKVVVGNTAKIEGDIDCMNIDIMGEVLGNITASNVTSLKNQARMVGNIITSALIIESEAFFSGNCQMPKREKKTGSAV